MKTIKALKEKLCNDIHDIVTSYGGVINAEEVNCYGLPVLCTRVGYTCVLSKLTVYGDVVKVYDKCADEYFSERNNLDALSLEAICEIKDWLDNNEDAITKAVGKVKKYVFRFHTHEWADIKVMAKTEAEAELIAKKTYNDGWYNTENAGDEYTSMENVTHEYEG